MWRRPALRNQTAAARAAKIFDETPAMRIEHNAIGSDNDSVITGLAPRRNYLFLCCSLSAGVKAN